MRSTPTALWSSVLVALLACGDARSVPPVKMSSAPPTGAPSSNQDGAAAAASGSGVAGTGASSGSGAGGTAGVSAGGASPGSAGSISPPDAGSKGGPSGGSDAPLVEIDSGLLRGTREASTHVFRGVPYAAPPIGELRLAPPKPPAPWTGERDASRFGPVCPQNVGSHDLATVIADLPRSEDCLSLNVFAPAEPGEGELPVMVFIHGGSFISGTGADYDGRLLSEAGGVVVVTLNYRLGALGALVNQALSDQLGVPSGNLAIRDQQAALSWVERNVAKFGGDPDNVTLFGESAGAISSCVHMFAKQSQGLARRFILESGACIQHAAVNLDRTSVQRRSDALVAKVCPGASDPVACLRGLDVELFVQDSVTMKSGTGEVTPDPLGEQWFPQVDGVVLEDLPLRLLAQGKYNRGEVLLGSQPHEAQMLRVINGSQGLPDSVLVFAIYMAAAYPGTWLALSSRYLPASDADALDSFERLTTETWMRCPVRAVARALSGVQSKVFMYSFELAPAVHTQELDYVFGLPLAAPMLTAPPLPVSAPLPLLPNVVRTFQSYWVNFARTGDPNGAALAAWPAYEQESDRHLVLNEAVVPGSGLAKAECDEWERALATAGRNN